MSRKKNHIKEKPEKLVLEGRKV